MIGTQYSLLSISRLTAITLAQNRTYRVQLNEEVGKR